MVDTKKIGCWQASYGAKQRDAGENAKLCRKCGSKKTKRKSRAGMANKSKEKRQLFANHAAHKIPTGKKKSRALASKDRKNAMRTRARKINVKNTTAG